MPSIINNADVCKCCLWLQFLLPVNGVGICIIKRKCCLFLAAFCLRLKTDLIMYFFLDVCRDSELMYLLHTLKVDIIVIIFYNLPTLQRLSSKKV
jgi:hypothetical protein